MAHPDSGPISFFTKDHRECDNTWAVFEACVTRGDVEGAQKAWKRFVGQLERHFTMEEQVLFPAIEEATGMEGGPTEVMRHEHAQMRALVAQMQQSAAANDVRRVLDQGDTLLMIIQQHNAKEEGILYPMAEEELRPNWSEVAAKLAPYL